MRKTNRATLLHQTETHNQVSVDHVSNRRREARDQEMGIKLPWPVEMLSPRSLRPAQRNARTHSKKQIRQIAESFRRFGVINPVIVDDHSRIAAGHARVEAAKLLGLKHVPVIRLSHLNETEIRAYMLADNKLAEKAGWDRETLAVELGELQIALPEIGLDLEITGFDPGEVDSIMVDFAEDRPDPGRGRARLTRLYTVDAVRKGRHGIPGSSVQRQD
jgi:ParB-like nuclease domain